ncbi:hypothetical protein C6A85_13950 [Mycobacterium sp. ITM-2017-0098]|nr:hypothetical protein C6A85_13950 [Mycobacterium sp. ITM-2017-0098]
MTTGDMYFIPRAYPHHIENIGTQTRDPESSPSPSAGWASLTRSNEMTSTSSGGGVRSASTSAA